MKKVKKSFSIIELNTISHCATILRACPGVTEFQMANNINACKVAADVAIKTYSEELELIKERDAANKAATNTQKDIAVLVKKQFESEYPELKESEFANLEISGNKEIPQQNGIVSKFSYRDAYFNLLGLVIV